MALKKGGLGRGIESIFDENSTYSDKIITLNINDIEPNRNQPRKNFSEESIAALADSIKQYGILQPVLVRPKDGIYQIVAGERRWRAAMKAELAEVPCLIRELSDEQNMLIAIIANISEINILCIPYFHSIKFNFHIYTLSFIFFDYHLQLIPYYLDQY